MDHPSSTTSKLIMKKVLTIMNVFTFPHTLDIGTPRIAVQMMTEGILYVKGMWEPILTLRPCVHLEVSKVDL